LLFPVFFTPIGGLVAGVIVGRQSHVGRGDGNDAERARWFVGNFMVTGVCAVAVFLICLGISAALSGLTPILGAVGVLGAIGAAVYTWVTTAGVGGPWRAHVRRAARAAPGTHPLTRPIGDGA
jgi:hypothetical protein